MAHSDRQQTPKPHLPHLILMAGPRSVKTPFGMEQRKDWAQLGSFVFFPTCPESESSPCPLASPSKASKCPKERKKERKKERSLKNGRERERRGIIYADLSSNVIVLYADSPSAHHQSQSQSRSPLCIFK